MNRIVLKKMGIDIVLEAKKPEAVSHGFWEKLKTGMVGRSPVMVWTYPELWNDLNGHPLKERSEMFKSLIKNLNWPKGTVSFVPMTEVSGDGEVDCPDKFWEVCAALDPQLVVSFGTRARDVLGLDPANERVLCLPESTPMSMGDDNPGKRETWEMLGTAFEKFGKVQR